MVDKRPQARKRNPRLPVCDCDDLVRPVASAGARLALDHAPPGAADSLAAKELLRLVIALARHDADAVWLHCKRHPSDDDAATNPPPPLPSCADLPVARKGAARLLDANVKASLLRALDATSSVLGSANLW